MPDTACRYTITDSESERIRLLKLWLTVMVVFIHSYAEQVHFVDGDVALDVPLWLDWTKYAVSKVICQCAVPGFFFLAGLLLYRRPFSWADNMRKKVKTLLIPYLLLNTFWIGFYFAAQHIGPLRGFFTRGQNLVAGWDWRQWLGAYTGMGRAYNQPVLYPLWFVRDLFVLNLLAPALKRLIDALPRITLAALGALALLNVDLHLFFLSRNGLVFFCLGCYAVRVDLHLSDLDRISCRLPAAAYLLAILADCLMRGRPLQYLAHFCVIVLGLLFFARCTALPRDPVWRGRLLALAGYSLPVYLFHEMHLVILLKLTAKLLPGSGFFLTVCYFGIPPAIIAYCVVLSRLMARFVPGLYRILTGGRRL